MTKLSDLLRSAADRAPVDGASVSVARAARRVRVQRGVRGAGNGVVGLGAAAVIILGVVQPGGAISGNQEDATGIKSGSPLLGVDSAASAINPGPDMRIAGWGYCGSFPLQDYGTGGTDALSIAPTFDASAPIDATSTLSVPVTVTANQDLNVSTSGPDAVVLWQGMVVATASASEAQQVLALASGDTTDSTATLSLIDCFVGAALPASDYQLVVSQAFNNADVVGPTPEPSPSPEPSVAPLPAPSPQTTFPLNPDASDVTSGAGVSTDLIPVDPQGWDYRITAEPIDFTVAGDPVDNPFGQYMPQQWTPPALPDDALTPSEARTLFETHATNAPWDMAKGTSRWIIPNYGSGVETFAVDTSQSYYGCSWDGTTGLTFPQRSADLRLLDISADVPSRVGLSYGWVVDGNPQVTISVTNTSEFTLSGFYGEPNRALYLVKDGRVVAQAYPANVDPYAQMGGKGIATPDGAPASQDDPATYWGLLAPGTTVSGTYLWRDVNGCSTTDGTSRLSSGTYTLLASQDLSLQESGPGTAVSGVPEPSLLRGTSGVSNSKPGDASAGGATTDIAIDPLPIQPGDYLDLQVWVSLGTVTIAAH